MSLRAPRLARTCAAPVERPRAARAFTILEVMVAAVVLVFGITTAITTLQSGMRAVATARAYTFASQVMQSELERLRLKSWAQLTELQASADQTVSLPTGYAGSSDSFACTRTIRDLKTDMKEITLVTTWRGIDGVPHTASYITRYSKTGLYDYFYTSH